MKGLPIKFVATATTITFGLTFDRTMHNKFYYRILPKVPYIVKFAARKRDLPNINTKERRLL